MSDLRNQLLTCEIAQSNLHVALHNRKCGCSFPHMSSKRSESLLWNATELAKTMARNGIPDRETLARRIKKPPTTVRRSISKQWDGEATGPILVAVSRELNVPPHKLYLDPRHH